MFIRFMGIDIKRFIFFKEEKKMQKNFNGSRKEHVKKFAATFAALIMVLTTMSAMMIFFATPVGAVGPETSIWVTDIDGNPKNDFAPGAIVYIHGSGFIYHWRIFIIHRTLYFDTGRTIEQHAFGSIIYLQTGI